MLKYAFQNECPWDYWGCLVLAHEHPEVLKWIQEIGERKNGHKGAMKELNGED